MKAAALSLVAVLTVLCAPTAAAAPEQFCAELHATWDGARCTTLVTSLRKAERFIAFDLPGGMIDNPTSGPVVRNFYHQLMDGWRASGAEALRDSSTTADYQLYSGPGGVESLIVHEDFEPFGIQPNNAYRSFVFGQGRRLALADLFKPGVDPMVAIPPAAAPALQGVLDAAGPPHAPGSYPFTVEHWQPGPNGPGYSGSYHTFALSSDALILYMPDVPMMRENSEPHQGRPGDPLEWSMDGGTVRVEVPLSALAGALRPEYGGG